MKKEVAREQVDKVLSLMVAQSLNVGDSIALQVEAGKTLFVLKQAGKPEVKMDFPAGNYQAYYARLCYMAGIESKKEALEGRIILGSQSGSLTFKVALSKEEKRVVLVLESKGETPNKG
jgi:hypothetical protein